MSAPIFHHRRNSGPRSGYRSKVSVAAYDYQAILDCVLGTTIVGMTNEMLTQRLELIVLTTVGSTIGIAGQFVTTVLTSSTTFVDLLCHLHSLFSGIALLLSYAVMGTFQTGSLSLSCKAYLDWSD